MGRWISTERKVKFHTECYSFILAARAKSLATKLNMEAVSPLILFYFFVVDLPPNKYLWNAFSMYVRKYTLIILFLVSVYRLLFTHLFTVFYFFSYFFI